MGSVLSDWHVKEIPFHKPERVLVTGGAGFLGINLIRYLLHRGVDVVSLDSAVFDDPEYDRVGVIRGVIRDSNSVDRALAGVNAVVQQAAELPLHKKRHSSHRSRWHKKFRPKYRQRGNYQACPYLLHRCVWGS